MFIGLLQIRHSIQDHARLYLFAIFVLLTWLVWVVKVIISRRYRPVVRRGSWRPEAFLSPTAGEMRCALPSRDCGGRWAASRAAATSSAVTRWTI